MPPLTRDGCTEEHSWRDTAQSVDEPIACLCVQMFSHFETEGQFERAKTRRQPGGDVVPQVLDVIRNDVCRSGVDTGSSCSDPRELGCPPSFSSADIDNRPRLHESLHLRNDDRRAPACAGSNACVDVGVEAHSCNRRRQGP